MRQPIPPRFAATTQLAHTRSQPRLSEMPDPRQQARTRTVRLLCALLREDPCVAARWMEYAPRGGRGIHQGAIAQVLAEHLWVTGQQPRSNTDLPRKLKDTVSRALSGKSLSRRSLRLFIQAFELDQGTTDRLWASWSGLDQTHVASAQRSRPNATSSRSAMTA